MANNNPSLPTKFTLNNNIDMPSIGPLFLVGTFKIRHPETIMKAMDNALASGYRLFDTATAYGNEVHIGNALKTLLPKYELDREDIFITSKIYPTDYGKDKKVTNAFKKSLKNLALDYIDMYLIHIPTTRKVCGEVKLDSLCQTTWMSFVKLYDEGLVNAIGVSNFTLPHLRELLKQCPGTTPAVNQSLWSPYYHQNKMLMYCKQNDIVLQAYSSLGGNCCELLNDPVIKKIALSHGVSSAQVLLNWTLQQDIAVIPKSKQPKHIKENITLNFELCEAEMKALNHLEEGNLKYGRYHI